MYKLSYFYFILFYSITIAAEVTFRVDMSNSPTSDDGVYVVGSSAELAGPEGHLMSDTDGDDIWEVTLSLPEGNYTYKFRNGYCDNWDNCAAIFEGNLEDCGVGDWDDREVNVGVEDILLDIYCFDSCSGGECPELGYFPVTFIVDMSILGPDPSGVFVTGGSQYMNGPLGHQMFDEDGDYIYETTINLPEGTYTFKFRNGYCDTWDSCPQQMWEDFEGECGVGQWGDRQVVVTDQGLTYGPYCFDFCDSGECMIDVPVEVEFQVELDDVEMALVDQGESVYIYGNFNDFDFFVNPIEMEYTGDNIFAYIETFTSDDFLIYKYAIGQTPESNDGIGACGNNFGGDCASNSTNWREHTVPYQDIVFDLDSFDDCTGRVRVELNVDMSSEFVSPSGVYIGGGTMPNDSYGTELCDPDGDNIFSTVMSFPINSNQTYKFSNGLCSDFDSCGTFEDLCECDDNGCNPNTNDWNDRYFFVGEEDGQIESAVAYGDCSDWIGYDGDDGGTDDGGGNDSYSVSISVEGLGDCAFASVTGTVDGWTGWGTAICDGNCTDNIQVVTLDGLEDGESHEFLILCAQGDAWWYNIWDSSVIIGPDLGSSCDFLPDDEFANYGFTIDGSDLEIFISDCSSGCMPGDVNDDQQVDVLDVVFIVGIVLGNNNPNAEESCGADYNGDDTIDILDIVAMVSTILG